MKAFRVAPVLLLLCAPSAFAAIPWREIRLGVETKPLVVTIGHPTTIRWHVAEHPAFIAVILDRDLHPRVAAAYEKFAAIAGVSGDPLYVVMTPHLAPLAADTDPAFLDDLAARWTADPNQLVATAGFSVRRHLLDEPPREEAPVTTPPLQRFDWIGGGVFRRQGEFDQALIDQAAFVLDCGDPVRARSTLDSAIGEFQDAGGAFVAGLRADSLVPRDGAPVVIEAGYYQWTLDELRHLIGPRADLFAFHYRMTEEGNFIPGYNVVLTPRDIGETTSRFSISAAELAEVLADVGRLVHHVRSNRPPPRHHPLFITEYNGRMISALARAFIETGESRYRDAAARASRAILQRNLSGSLLRSAGVPALPEDYSAMIRALLDMYDATFDLSFVERAIELQRLADASSPPAVPEPVAQLAPQVRDVLAPRNIVELAAMTGDAGWVKRAGPAFAAYRQVIIAGDPNRDETRAMLQEARASEAEQTIFFIGNKRIRTRLESWMPYVKDIVEIDGNPVAAVCRARTCGTASAKPPL